MISNSIQTFINFNKITKFLIDRNLPYHYEVIREVGDELTFWLMLEPAYELFKSAPVQWKEVRFIYVLLDGDYVNINGYKVRNITQFLKKLLKRHHKKMVLSCEYKQSYHRDYDMKSGKHKPFVLAMKKYEAMDCIDSSKYAYGYNCYEL